MVNQRKFDPQVPLQEGEFRRIDGIAETTEKSLHEAGINTFEELSILSPQEIAGKLKGVAVLEKINRNDWTGQAAELARQLAETRLPAKKDDPEERQYYESFMVVLLLDDQHEVRRTKISHVQKGTETSWAGWDEPRLVDWISAQAKLARKQTSVKEHVLKEEPPSVMLRKAPPQKLTGNLKLRKLQIIAPSTTQVKQAVCPGDPFGVRFRLDFDGLEIPQAAHLMYRAEIRIHTIKDWKRAYCKQVEGQVLWNDEWGPEPIVPGLPEGFYHLDVAVQVYPAGSTDPARDGLYAQTEGKMLQVIREEPKPVKPVNGKIVPLAIFPHGRPAESSH